MKVKNLLNDETIDSPLVFFPSRLTDINKMGKELVKGRSIIVNLTTLDSEEQLRILDFLSGVSFVIGAKRERLDKFIYLFNVNKE